MSTSLSFPDSRSKWKKRKKDTTLGSNSKRQRPEDEDDDEEEDDDVDADEDEDLHPINTARPTTGAPASAAPDSGHDTRESEVLSDGGVRISDFPAVIKHTVNRPHSSVLAIVDAEHALQFSDNRAQQNSYFFENISHGQLQALSAALSDSPSLAQSDQDRDGSSSAYVCTPPQIMEGRGVVKRFGNNRVLIVPMHADWFSPNSVHRLERQVVPHFFSGKSVEHTPEKYMECRNRIVAKYMGNPEKRLSLNDCQGLGVSIEMHDLNRIVRFLDHWGIINYSAATTNHEPRISGQYLREEPNGELHVPSPALRSIDSLIHFDKPKSRLKPSDVSSSPSCPGDEFSDLDRRIRELLSENHCYCCSRPLPRVYYQSQKEVDVLLCLDCFHEGRFVIGHSSMDFIRVDSMRELCDIDGDSWTDQETLLLLEALEIYNDNWNEIAEHVGTKSKAQCILHFVRLPMEDGLLENIEVPSKSVSANVPNIADGERQYANSNGHSIANLDSESRLPFASASNPLMSLTLMNARKTITAHVCTNESYKCSCPKGTHGDGFKGGSGTACIKNQSRVIEIALVGGSCVLLFVIIGVTWSCWVFQKRKLKQKFFQENGGVFLNQLLALHGDDRERKLRIFTSEELMKATNNYNESRIVGKGGYGTVYKGTLPDGRDISIKISKETNKIQVKEFINEIVILARLNHENVVKLLRCCLETPVPILVYEFITRGTLFHRIHGDGRQKFVLSWEDRLRIVAETAGALAYLHSAGDPPIIHGDVKSMNILLDDKFTAKVSDFGVSRLVPLNQMQLSTLVQGTFGYIDPEYMQTRQLIDKSDVYSFGAVLVELLTGKKIYSDDRPEEQKNMAKYFVLSMKQNRLFDVLEDEVMHGGNHTQLQGVADLAEQCLRLNGEERPTMKEVAVELDYLRGRGVGKHSWVKENYDEESVHLLVESSLDSQIESSTRGVDSLKNQVILSLDGAR